MGGQYYKYFIGHDRFLVNFFDLDREWNLPTWYSSNSLLFSAILLFIIAYKKKADRDKYRLHWRILAFAFLYIGLDEIFQIHEMVNTPLRNLLHLEGIFHFSWTVPAGIILTVLAFLYTPFLMALPWRFSLQFLLSGMIYISGGLGLEMIGGYYASHVGKENFTYAVLTNLEEILEMTGGLLFIRALLSYFATEIQTIQVAVTSQDHHSFSFSVIPLAAHSGSTSSPQTLGNARSIQPIE